MRVAIVGAGPHGREIASFTTGAYLLDDHLPGYPGAATLADAFLAGAAWPAVRRQIDYRASLREPAWNNGIVIFPGARIGQDVHLGRHAHVGYNAVVSHGCSVGAYVNICPNVTLAGDVTVDDDVFVGAGAVVIHGGIHIGRGAVIGAGAVVVRDVPPCAVVKGVPAR